MVVIRINGNIHPERAKIIVEGIHNQAHAGVIVVPHFCEVLHNDQDDDIKVVTADEVDTYLSANLSSIKQLLQRLRACVFTAIDPELALLAANTIEAQQASLAGNCERVEKLEAELAAAMEYINATKSCENCKHELPHDSQCPADCECCDGEPCAHICQHCTVNASKWEWRGTHG